MYFFLYVVIILISLYTFKFAKLVWKDGNWAGAVFVSFIAILLLLIPVVNRFLFNYR
ncbi:MULTISPECIES: hypothetical protein [Bacillaceae]|uniref:hypothetical protein n=1 Tax=Bacillaceae TaxID=186817 RepID=UPI001C5850A8|nr:hypothetical protein [Rossellomorea sp. YZS02]MBW3110781.1 hypothetical protein [Bacillus sp. MCCB 382]MDX8343307.1 hypothetical protein [Rossellomorea sp. YZS02]